MFCALTARVGRASWATGLTQMCQGRPYQSSDKCAARGWGLPEMPDAGLNPRSAAAMKAWQGVHHTWLCAGFRAPGFISCVQTWCEILLEVPCFALVHFNLTVCTLNSGNKDLNAVSRLWKANSTPVNSSVVMFQCDSMSQVRKGGTSGFRGILCYPLHWSWGIFLAPSMKKESYLKKSNRSESSDCVGRPVFSLYLTWWKDLHSHVFVSFLCPCLHALASFL